MTFEGAHFCLTGTFAFGERKECEAAVADRRGVAGSLTKGTQYLVVGAHATDSRRQSGWGRKVERAAGRRDAGHPIAIVSEARWASQL